MKVIHSDQPHVWEHEHWRQRSVIFLVGPTPRSPEVQSWRPEAIRILRDELKFEGTVLVPEPSTWEAWPDYLNQIEWEFEGLTKCNIIAAWVPRSEVFPAFTTNVEFGYWVNSGRLVYGRPDGTPHTGYLDWLYKRCEPQLEVSNTLKDLLIEAVRLCEDDKWRN